MSSFTGRFSAANGNLSLLQEFVRKDPDSYKDEFLEQYHHYVQTLKLLQLQPHQHRSDVQALVNSVNFLATVAPHYPIDAKPFADDVISILRSQGAGLDPEIRLAFCKALVSLRNRRIVSAYDVLQLFFELVKCEDKILRKFLYGSIVTHIKRLNTKGKDQKLNSQLRAFIIAKLKDSRSIVARTAELVLIDAFRKNYWRDATTANAVAECCFHRVNRMKVAAMKFFLGSTNDEEGIEDGSSDDDEGGGGKREESKTFQEVMTAFKASKKTRKKIKNLEKAKKALSKQKKSKKESRSSHCNLMAINFLFDAQSFVDRLFRSLEEKKSERFEIRLLQMGLCARVIGIHKLQTLGFYSFLYRYLQPKQRDVTRILLYAAQASHELIPPDIIEQLVKTVAQNFITDRNTTEGITVGLNAVREILANCPFAATADLLRDLTEYKSYKNKNVSMAARGLITLFRSINPKMLHRKDRGRPTESTKELVTIQFAGTTAKPYVPGAECLPTTVDDAEPDDDDSDYDTDDDESDEEISVSAEAAIDDEEPMDKFEKAQIVSEIRVLNQEEHRQIAAYQLKKQLSIVKAQHTDSRKRRNDDVKLDDELVEKQTRRDAGDGLPRLNDIEQFHKKIRRQDKDERMKQVEEGRTDRGEFGKPKKRGPHVGRTNRELAKRKNYQMIRQKVRGKNRQRSFREQQQSLREYLVKHKGK